MVAASRHVQAGSTGPASVRAHLAVMQAAAAAAPPPLMVLLALGSYQLGAALAKSLFAGVGPAGAVFLRVALAACLLLLLVRPGLTGRGRNAWVTVVLFGLALAGMNLAFFLALERVPLGPAVALEFVGPLAVAVAGSRQRRDLLWTSLAGAGVALFVPWGGGGLDPAGLGLVLIAAACWAAYILLVVRAGHLLPGQDGLVLAMVVAALALAPTGLARGQSGFLAPGVLALGLVVAVLCSAIPFSLEYAALKRVPARVFAALVALDPVVATIVGFIVLREIPDARTAAAATLVTTGALGAALTNRVT